VTIRRLSGVVGLQSVDLCISLLFQLLAVRTLELKEYGLAATALAALAVAVAVVEYGFNYSIVSRTSRLKGRRRTAVFRAIADARILTAAIAGPAIGLAVYAALPPERGLLFGGIVAATVGMVALAPGWRYMADGSFHRFIAIQTLSKIGAVGVASMALLQFSDPIALVALPLLASIPPALLGGRPARSSLAGKRRLQYAIIELRRGAALFASTLLASSQRSVVALSVAAVFGFEVAALFAVCDKVMLAVAALRTAVIQTFLSDLSSATASGVNILPLAIRQSAYLAILSIILMLGWLAAGDTMLRLLLPTVPGELDTLLQLHLVSTLPAALLSYVCVTFLVRLGRSRELLLQNVAGMAGYAGSVAVGGYFLLPEVVVLGWIVVDSIIALAIVAAVRDRTIRSRRTVGARG